MINFKELQAGFTTLSINFKELQAGFTTLSINFKELQAGFTTLSINFKQMQAGFTTLSINFKELQAGFTTLYIKLSIIFNRDFPYKSVERQNDEIKNGIYLILKTKIILSGTVMNPANKSLIRCIVRPYNGIFYETINSR